MKKYVFLLAVLIAWNFAFGQRTKVYTNAGADLSRGIGLSREGYYAISCKYLERFIEQTMNECIQSSAAKIGAEFVGINPAETNLVEQAEYTLVFNHFMMKSKDFQDRADAHLAKYPETDMRSQLYFMKGRCYYERKDWKHAVEAYDNSNANDLKYEDAELLTFSNAYSHLMLKEYDKASRGFKTSMSTSRNYYNEAGYYYGYSEFCQQHYTEAIEAFHLLDDNSKFKEAAEFHILQIYDARGQRTAAVEKGKELLKYYPKSKYRVEAYRIIGENAFRAQNYTDAASALGGYVHNAKEPNRENIYMHGVACYQSLNFSGAIESMNRLTSHNDSLTTNAYLYAGYCYLELNEPQKARMAFQRASQTTTDPQAREEAAYNYALATYESRAPFGETVKSFEAFADSFPNSTHRQAILELTADAYMDEPDYQAAINAIDKMDVLTPKLRQVKETAYFRLGLNAMEQRNYDKAKEYFTQSISLNNTKSESAQVFLWRAECSYKQGNLADAQSDLKKYLATSQRKSADCLLKAYYTLGYTYWEQKDYRMARPYFSKFNEVAGSRQSPLWSDVACRIGDCYYNNRDFDNALNTYWEIPVSNRHSDYSLYQIAQIYGLQHNYPERLKALEKLMERHPNSDLHDEAMYEVGRTYVLQDKNNEAITAYKALQKAHPMSKWTRKATLELAMLNANMGHSDEAIEAYKYVVDKYPTSEEARVALEGMQGLYVEANKVEEYVEYRRSVSGITLHDVNQTEEDSLQFLAAERVYIKGDLGAAVKSLNNYMMKYCDELTSNCITAEYYLAESYYRLDNRKQAMLRYHHLTTLAGNNYMEEALLRAAEIAYDAKEYASANTYFSKLLLVATTNDNRSTARLGMLRCSFYTNLYEQTVDAANRILSTDDTPADLQTEARYNRAKSYTALHKPDSANTDLVILRRETNTAIGAESNYLYAQNLYDLGQKESSEKVILQFIEAGTSYQYWMARSFILLSDIYRDKDDKVMSEMYLQSLKENYEGTEEDIQDMINERLMK